MALGCTSQSAADGEIEDGLAQLLDLVRACRERRQGVERDAGIVLEGKRSRSIGDGSQLAITALPSTFSIIACCLFITATASSQTGDARGGTIIAGNPGFGSAFVSGSGTAPVRRRDDRLRGSSSAGLSAVFHERTPHRHQLARPGSASTPSGHRDHRRNPSRGTHLWHALDFGALHSSLGAFA
jgi:hypothetical protein